MYETLEEVYRKVDWEGGLLEAVFSYGLHATHLADNEELRELKAAWTELDAAWPAFAKIVDRIEDILENRDYNETKEITD